MAYMILPIKMIWTICILNHCKTDVHFNHDHDFHEVAQLEKWNDLAQKWFRHHGDDLRSKFSKRWSGLDGRFQKEIKKLERSFARKCSAKNLNHQLIKDAAILDANGDENASNSTKKRRSDEDLEIFHNSGDRILHIIHNVEYWIETYLSACPQSERIVRRWGGSNGEGGFVGKWEREIAKNPIFQEELEEEERFLDQRSQSGARRCGMIFNQFGLNGWRYPLYDASFDSKNGIDDLRNHPFGDDELMSVRPYPGWI